MYFGLNAALRASGHPREAMIATINTVVINTILDPLFIFVFGWGIQGAAIATVLSQTISLVWQLRIFSNPDEVLHFFRDDAGNKHSLLIVHDSQDTVYGFIKKNEKSTTDYFSNSFSSFSFRSPALPE